MKKIGGESAQDGVESDALIEKDEAEKAESEVLINFTFPFFAASSPCS